ncbi:MAG: MFS transporter [Phycisphaerae bacterium]|nr:MFS transporter [Phycisphaerae bacterium]
MSMPLGLRVRLSVMMFLTYVTWGAWLPLLSVYLRHPDMGFTGRQIGLVFAAMAIASVTAMLISAQVADRWFSTERFMAISSVAGAVLIYIVSMQTTFWPFFIAFLCYCIVYIPMLSLANSMSFAHMEDAQRDFGGIRLWGTIGWIAVSLPFILLLGDKADPVKLRWTFYLSGTVSVVLGLFSLTLPHTPPKKDAVERFAPFRALSLLGQPAFLILIIVTLSDAMVNQCHFMWTGPYFEALGVPARYIPLSMAVGQAAEIITMFMLGWTLKRFGWRKVLAVGVFAHVIRFGVYSYGAGKPELAWLMIACNVVHGAAYTFFFAAVYIYADEHAPKDIRASAQMLFNLVIVGGGQLFGSLVFGALGDVFEKAGGGIDYRGVFLVPTIWALVTGVVLLVGFWPTAKVTNDNAEPDSGLGDGEAEVEARLRDLGYIE